MIIKIVKAHMTCGACPSQWNAWDAEGNYYYLRYRSGIGTVQQCESEDALQHDTPNLVRFEYGDWLDGCLTLEEFAELAGLDITDAEQTSVY